MSNIIHFGTPGYRPACSLVLASSPDIYKRVNPDHKATTCIRCMETLKYKRASKEKTVTEQRESSDLVQQMLMKMNPTICTAIYRDDQGHKLYCNLPKDHKEDCGSCPKPEARVFPLPPTTERSVYCVHCQQFHAPRNHRVSFDYPPIPYAREHFITRQADLRGEMENYIAGRLNQDDLVGVIQRIEAEYVQAMNDLHTQGLI